MKKPGFKFQLLALGLIPFILLLYNGCNQPFRQGQALYEANCSRCHGMDGNGFEDLYPGIRESPYLTQADIGLACVIAYGSTFLDGIRQSTADISMPENNHLSPVEVLNIINYLSWEFGSGEPATIDMVVSALEDCKP